MAKVLVLAGYAPSLINFRGQLLRAMRELGLEVSASAPEPDAMISDALAKRGVAYHAVPMSRAGIDPIGDLFYAFRLWKLFRSQRPNVVLAYTIKPVIFGLLAARLAGVRRRVALITGLGYAFMGGTSLRQRAVGWAAVLLYRLALRGVERVFLQNPDDRSEFVRLRILAPDARVTLVNGSGVDLTHFSQAPLTPAPTFLMIARLLRDKGVIEYVEAAKIVKDRFPAARFMLVGGFDPNPSGISPDEVASWVAAGHIEHLGELKDVRPALAECSVFVLPSYREGTPRTVLEAMATGRPIITTDTAGCRETVEHERNGFLVPVRDASALAQRMIQLMESPQLVEHMASQSRLMAEEKYDVNKVNAAMLEAMDLA